MKALQNLEKNQQEIEIMAKKLNESTAFTWLWALLFNWLWFIWYGFYKKAFLVLLLDFVLIGIVAAPFLAYSAWKQKARQDAKEMAMIYNN